MPLAGRQFRKSRADDDLLASSKVVIIATKNSEAFTTDLAGDDDVRIERHRDQRELGSRVGADEAAAGFRVPGSRSADARGRFGEQRCASRVSGEALDRLSRQLRSRSASVART